MSVQTNNSPVQDKSPSAALKLLCNTGRLAEQGIAFTLQMTTERLAGAENLLKKSQALTADQVSLLEKLVANDRLNIKMLGNSLSDLSKTLKNTEKTAGSAATQHRSGMYGSEQETSTVASKVLLEVLNRINLESKFSSFRLAAEASNALESKGTFVLGDPREFLQRNLSKIQEGARLVKAYGHLTLQAGGVLPGFEWAVAASGALLVADEYLQKKFKGKVDPEIPLLQATASAAAIYSASKYFGFAGSSLAGGFAGAEAFASAGRNLPTIISSGSATAIQSPISMLGLGELITALGVGTAAGVGLGSRGNSGVGTPNSGGYTSGKSDGNGRRLWDEHGRPASSGGREPSPMPDELNKIVKGVLDGTLNGHQAEKLVHDYIMKMLTSIK